MVHLIATGVGEVERTDGCLGATILRQQEGANICFTLLSKWRDEAAIQRFARGNEAVLYSGDEAFGLVADPMAAHHLVAYESCL